MSAIYVIDDHVELANVGQTSHAALDTHVSSSHFLLLSSSTTISPEARLLSTSAGITTHDDGAGGNFTLAIDFNVLAARTGSSFTGDVTFNAGLTGSLQKVSDGSSYLKAGSGISISSASNGSVTISATSPSGSGTLPTPTQMGQVLIATTPSAFVVALPITTLTSGWLVNDQGYLLVST